MANLFSGKEFDSYLPIGCVYCPHFQAILEYQLAHPEIEDAKPTFTKCIPKRLESGERGRSISIVYINSHEDAPLVTKVVEEPCPDNLGSMGLNTGSSYSFEL